jgi:heme/copper-type cytochrome/quinol oxidase subunit 2
MLKNEITLKSSNQFLKIFVLPILAIITFTLFVFLTGYRGRMDAAVPTVLLLKFKWIWIVFMSIVFLFFLYISIKIAFLKTIDKRKRISIDDKTIKVETSDYVMYFRIKKAQRLNYKTSKLWARLFYLKFYRIGIISIKYDNDSYTFYFPVRNQGIQDELKTLLGEKNR